MFTMDIPNIPAQNTPSVLALAESFVATSPVNSALQADYLLKMCTEKSSGEDMNVTNIVSPATWLASYIGNQEKRDIDPDTAIVNVTLISATAYGKLIQKNTDSGRVYFTYEPIRDYEGKDSAVFMAEFEGKRYQVVVNFIVSKMVDFKTPLCPAPQLIKVTN